MLRAIVSHHVVWVRIPPGVTFGWSLSLILALARAFFSGFYSFPPSKISSKFEFDQDRGAAWKPARVDVTSSLNIATSFYYLLFYVFFLVCCMPLT